MATMDTISHSGKELASIWTGTRRLPRVPRMQPQRVWTPIGLHREALSRSWIVRSRGCKRMITGQLDVVARDGIEPPTPAFSGLDSSAANYLNPLAQSSFHSQFSI